jgi:hypothetical protein
VTAADYSRFMSAYYRRMDPSQTAVACGCCGVMDVPVKDPDAETEAMGILAFTKIELRSTTAATQHTCSASGKCSFACPCFLAPLQYSPAELDTYNVDFPTHIVPPMALSAEALAAWRTEQHETWLLYRPIVLETLLELEQDTTIAATRARTRATRATNIVEQYSTTVAAPPGRGNFELSSTGGLLYVCPNVQCYLKLLQFAR